MQVLAGEGQGPADAVRRRLELQQGGKLRLAAQPAVVDHHGPGDRPAHLCAEILLDQSQRQIDAGGDPGGGPDAAVADVDLVGVDTPAGRAALQLGGVGPVGGRAAPVQQPGLGQQEGRGADARDPPGAPSQAVDRLQHVVWDRQLAALAPDHHQGVQRRFAYGVGGHGEPGGAGHHPAAGADDLHPIGAGPQRLRLGEDGHRAAQVEQLEPVVDQEHDGTRHGANRGINVVSATQLNRHNAPVKAGRRRVLPPGSPQGRLS